MGFELYVLFLATLLQWFYLYDQWMNDLFCERVVMKPINSEKQLNSEGIIQKWKFIKNTIEDSLT